MQVVSTGSYTITLDLDVTEVADVAEGQQATVTAGTGGTAATGTGGTAATGTVTSVGAIADASSGVATYPVEVAFEGSPDVFTVGATAGCWYSRRV